MNREVQCRRGGAPPMRGRRPPRSMERMSALRCCAPCCCARCAELAAGGHRVTQARPSTRSGRQTGGTARRRCSEGGWGGGGGGRGRAAGGGRGDGGVIRLWRSAGLAHTNEQRRRRLPPPPPDPSRSAQALTSDATATATAATALPHSQVGDHALVDVLGQVLASQHRRACSGGRSAQ